jgi:hypothetical protein
VTYHPISREVPGRATRSHIMSAAVDARDRSAQRSSGGYCVLVGRLGLGDEETVTVPWHSGKKEQEIFWQHLEDSS